MPFLFRDLDVYRQTTAFVGEAERIASSWAAREPDLADQLRRATQKIPVQIAEGYGRWHAKDKVQFYRFALGSVNECVGHFDVAVQKGLMTEVDAKKVIEGLDRIAQMLQRLIQSVFSRRT